MQPTSLGTAKFKVVVPNLPTGLMINITLNVYGRPFKFEEGGVVIAQGACFSFCLGSI